MRMLVLILLLVLPHSLLGQVGLLRNTGIEELRIKGNFSRVIIINYDAEYRDGEYERIYEWGIPGIEFDCRFDKKGNLVRDKIIKRHRIFEEHAEYEYLGDSIRKTSYLTPDTTGLKVSYITKINDELWMEVGRDDVNGNRIDPEYFEFPDKRTVRHIFTRNRGGSIDTLMTGTYIFGRRGLLDKEIVHIYKTGELIDENVLTHEHLYDKKGKATGKRIDNNGNITEYYYRYLEYDDRGNWTLRILTEEPGENPPEGTRVSVDIREIEYY